MTREEAIKYFENGINTNLHLKEKDKFATEIANENIEAYSMAISALSVEPCEDYISRTEVIKAIDEREDVNGKVNAEDIRTDIVTMTVIRESRTSEDCISRQAVIDELNKWDWQELYLPIHFKENIIDVLPGVQPKKGEWIPVSERLPEERHTYEVTLRGIGELEGEIDNEVAYATWFGNKNNRKNNWLYHSDVDNWKDKEVIAWKPRSKPYKPESEESMITFTENQQKIVNALEAVSTAHWIDNHNGTISCSSCHTWFRKDDRYPYMRHCPYCSVKMAESEDK